MDALLIIAFLVVDARPSFTLFKPVSNIVLSRSTFQFLLIERTVQHFALSYCLLKMLQNISLQNSYQR